MISVQLIVAVDEDRGIAKRGKIPWWNAADRKHFRSSTVGYPVLMGRKTEESLTVFLAKRDNYVLSRTPRFREGFRYVSSPEILLEHLETLHCDTLWVIGGEEVYKLMLPYAHELWETEVLGSFGCDQFFHRGEVWSLKEERELDADAKLRHFVRLVV